MAKPKSSPWYIYLLRCQDHSLYCGITNNLHIRLMAHNRGHGARYTRARRPVDLVWSMACKDRHEASCLEPRLKRMSKAFKEEIVLEQCQIILADE